MFSAYNLSHITNRPHQDLFDADVKRRIELTKNPDYSRRHFLYAAPTGSGKSVCLLRVLEKYPTAFAVTPRVEIVTGMLDKIGVDTSKLSTASLVEAAMSYRISTPIRTRNLLAKGELPFRPDVIVIDEVHHSTADTYQQLKAYLPNAIWIGLTATPFRGTPKGTNEFLNQWDDEINWILRIPKAVRDGIISLPDIKIWPLCDDDSIEIVNGEFKVGSASESGVSRSKELAKMVKAAGFYRVESGMWAYDRPTMFAVSTVDHGRALVENLLAEGLPAEFVYEETRRSKRLSIFTDCIAKKTALVQIDVVGEGVDLPIRRIIDDRPTMSPVRFKQLYGRAERPLKAGELPSEIICCNRNIERHIYLYEGLIPSRVVLESQVKFGKPMERSVTRALGLEGLGRFEAAEIKFKDGLTGELYSLYSPERTEDGYKKVEYCVLIHPCLEPIYAKKVSKIDASGSPTWGKWEAIDGIPDISGFSSTPPRAISEKQKARWTQQANYYGLDATVTPNRKNIQSLFLLLDTRKRIL